MLVYIWGMKLLTYIKYLNISSLYQISVILCYLTHNKAYGVFSKTIDLSYMEHNHIFKSKLLS